MKAVPRLSSLDACRGLVVAAMIVVNSPGDETSYPWLRHAPWHGWTPADLVFPAFLVIMGAAVPLAAAARRAAGVTAREAASAVLKRAALLFGLGLLVNAIVFDPGAIRWPGVLQRIAACYLACSALESAGGPPLWLAATLAALGAHAALLALAAPPGCPAGALTPECAWPCWLDRRILGAHMLRPLYDPEGILGTIPAAATAVLGMLAGRRLARGDARAGALVAGGGLLLTACGSLWARTLPLNKHLWTSSYALYNGGLAVTMLGVAEALWRLSPGPLAAFAPLGRRALAAYALSGGLYGLLEFLPARLPDGEEGDLRLALTRVVLARVTWSPRAASAAFAVLFTAACAWLAARVAPTRSGAPRSARAARPCAPARSRRARPSRRRSRRPARPTAA